MYKAKKVTAQIYGCAKAHLDNECSYEDTRRGVFTLYKVYLGNSTIGLINKSFDYTDYCNMKKNGRKETRLGEIDTFKIFLSSDQKQYHFNRVQMTFLIILFFLIGCLISLYIL